LPPTIEPFLTRINVHVGACTDCDKRVQGRHPLQTSDALGAAASQLGPRVLALAADLKIDKGLSYGKISGFLQEVFSIGITRGGLCQALQRMAKAATPTYEALRDAVSKASVVSPDETGWRVGGLSAWLWVFVSSTITLYTIEKGRGFREAAKVLGEGFKGILARDGWAPYRRFTEALHQTCFAHLLRRCGKILKTAKRGAARVPHAVRRILQGALDLRDRRDAGAISDEMFEEGFSQLRSNLEQLLTRSPTVDENRKLLNHLRNEWDVGALFTFLEHPESPATNFWSEQELRPLISTRKNCGGGNRTWEGAKALAILASVMRTCRKQGLNPLPVLVLMLSSKKPAVISELIPQQEEPAPHLPTSH
jgi:transposase